MTNLDKLIAHFEKFPGIGGRQAKRFAFHILILPEAEARDLSELIGSLKSVATECASCHRFFALSHAWRPAGVDWYAQRAATRSGLIARDLSYSR